MRPHTTSGSILRRGLYGVNVFLNAISFGAGGGALGTMGLLTVMSGGLRQDGWGAAPAWLFFMALGGLGGLVAAAVMAFAWLRDSSEVLFVRWEWLMQALGSALAVAIVPWFFPSYYVYMKFLIAMTLLPALGWGCRWLWRWACFARTQES